MEFTFLSVNMYNELTYKQKTILYCKLTLTKIDKCMLACSINYC